MATVLLGLCDEEIKSDSPIPASEPWTCNRIGSRPDWMYSTHPRPVCKLCREPLYLVVQVYCPLAESKYHRTIYVFACIGKACQNQAVSWTVLRGQLLVADDNNSKTQQQDAGEQHAAMATGDWCDEADDWGDDVEGAGVDLVATTTETKHELSSEEFPDKNCERSLVDAEIVCTAVRAVEQLSLDQGGHHTEEVPCFRGFFINVFEEESWSASGDLTSHEQKLLAEYQEREGVNVSDFEVDASRRPQSGGSEHYEKSTASHGDKIFQKFLKRISGYPDQCLRYEWNGRPLLMTGDVGDHSSVPVCDYCGGLRTFEIQLMPALVSVLKLHHTKDPPLDFGSVYVYTCKNSCWNDEDVSKYREEFLILQPDPDQKYFKQHSSLS